MTDTPTPAQIEELEGLTRTFMALVEQLDLMSVSDGIGEPEPIADGAWLHEALYEALGDECEATVGDLRKLTAKLPALLAAAKRATEMEKALKPFACAANLLDPEAKATLVIESPRVGRGTIVVTDDLRRAALVAP